MCDDELKELDRPSIWRYAWEVRGLEDDSRAGVLRARKVIRRWETLTGKKYRHG